MICKYCGRNIPDAARLCPYCRKPVVRTAMPRSQATVPNNNSMHPSRAGNRTMFCKKCGTPIQPGMRVCKRCGTPVGTVQNQPVRKPAQNVASNRAPVRRAVPTRNVNTNPNANAAHNAEMRRRAAIRHNFFENRKRMRIAVIAAAAIVLIGAAVPITTGIVSHNNTKKANAFIASLQNKDDKYVNNSTGKIHNASDDFEDQTITSGSAAVSVAEDFKKDFGMNGEGNTLKAESEFSCNGHNYYRVAQYYNDIRVYERDIIIKTDKNGKVETATSNCVDCSEIDTDNRLSDDEIRDKAAEEIGDILEIDADEVKESALKGASMEPSIYVFNDKPVYATVVQLSYYGDDGISYPLQFVFDATTGELITYDILQQDISKVANNSYYNYNNINYVDSNDVPDSFSDDKRKIKIYYIQDENNEDKTIDNMEVYKASSGDDDATQTATNLYNNLENIYDCFNKTLNHKSLDGKGLSDINVYFYAYDEDEDGNVLGDNAVYAPLGGNFQEAILLYKPVELDNLSKYVDVFAHEYTHGIVAHTSGFDTTAEPRALNEAFADIFGECAEAIIKKDDIDWVMGKDAIKKGDSIRDYSNLVGEQASTYDEYDESLDEHDAATLIGEIAYNMYQGGITDPEVMLKIWYSTLLQLHSNATFADCAETLKNTAKQFKNDGTIDNNQLSAVNDAIKKSKIPSASNSGDSDNEY